MTDEKIGNYKNEAGFTLDGPPQADKKDQETQPSNDSNDEDGDTPPWKKARSQIDNCSGLNQHNIEVMTETYRKKIGKTIDRIEEAGREVPDRLDEAYRILCRADEK